MLAPFTSLWVVAAAISGEAPLPPSHPDRITDFAGGILVILLLLMPVLGSLRDYLAEQQPTIEEEIKTIFRGTYWSLVGICALLVLGAQVSKHYGKTIPAFDLRVVAITVGACAVVAGLFAWIGASYTGDPYGEDRGAEWRIAQAGPYEKFPLERSSHQRWATRREAIDHALGPGAFRRSVRDGRVAFRILGTVLSLTALPLTFLVLGAALVPTNAQESWTLWTCVGLVLAVNLLATLASIRFARPID